MKERIITPQVLEQFAHHLAAEEKSQGTIDKYVRDARFLMIWLAGQSAIQPAQSITKEALAAWKSDMLQSGRAPATINSMIAAINSLLNFMGLQHCRIKSIRLQKRFFRADERQLTKPEYEKLLKTAHKNGKSSTALLMETICATGIRVSEIRYITLEAARQGRTQIFLKGKHRIILLPGKLCKKLKQYAAKQGITTGSIFLSKSGRPLDRRQIWAQMKSLCKATGVSARKVFPHNLRHLFARAFYASSHDIVSLADVLGHSSVETTRIYLVTTETEHVKQIAHLNLVL